MSKLWNDIFMTQTAYINMWESINGRTKPFYGTADNLLKDADYEDVKNFMATWLTNNHNDVISIINQPYGDGEVFFFEDGVINRVKVDYSGNLRRVIADYIFSKAFKKEREAGYEYFWISNDNGKYDYLILQDAKPNPECDAFHYDNGVQKDVALEEYYKNHPEEKK